jgi:hypothetical protein
MMTLSRVIDHRRHVSPSGYGPDVPNGDFWIAVERLVEADDAGEDIATLADDLLDADASLCLALNPGVTLTPLGESTASRDRYTIDLSIGDSTFGWPRWITEAVADHQCRRQEKNLRWRAIFAQHEAEHVIIHLSAAPRRPQRVGKPHSHADQYCEVNITWDVPRSPFRLPEYLRTVLDAVATQLERT